MKTFIRVVELWVPDRTRMRLEFGGGLYGEGLSAFKAVSEGLRFGHDVPPAALRLSSGGRGPRAKG